MDTQQGNNQDIRQQGQQPNRQDDEKHQMRGGVDESGESGSDPEKRTQIDDNPDETKKKIPNMQNKR